MICQPIGLRRDTLKQIKIPPFEPSFERIAKSVRNHKGEPFNTIDYPWTKGICDAWDDPDVRTIWLQFAARIGKTQLAQSLMVSAIGHDPVTWMYGNATETLVKETVRDKYYPMFERCSFTRKWVPPKTRRIQTRIDLATCVGYCGWAGSTTSLADKDPKYLHGGEIDKWTKNKSEEADSLELFLERGLEIPDRKAILESTPSIKNRSRVELGLTQGWDCRFQVPCPKCGYRQELVFGESTVKGEPPEFGIIFDRGKDGRLDPRVAYETARYRCESCGKEFGDEDKKPAIEKGIWVPKGQWLTKTGKLRGTMQNPGPDASFQLSRIYAPTFTFGDVARQFVVAYNGNEEKIKNFRNSWLGLTWEPIKIERSWEEVARLLCSDYELTTIPEDGYFLTCAVDVQYDHWVFMVIAWASEQRGYVVDYGIKHSWQQIADVIRTPYRHMDGGPAMVPEMTLIDARDGNRTDEVVSFCRTVNQESGPWVWPCMGSSSGLMRGNPYRKQVIEAGNKRGKATKKNKNIAFGWITVNTNYFQQWIHNCLFRRKAGKPLSLSFPQNAQPDRDLWEQLMNEIPDVTLDSTGHDRVQWIVAHDSIPVDLRDCGRYNRCAAEVFTRGNWARVPKRRKIVAGNTVSPGQMPARQKPKPKDKRHPVQRTRQRSRIRQLTNRRIGKRRDE